MEIIDYENICRLCLTEVKHFSEPLGNWVDSVMQVCGVQMFLDDGLPQQVCLDCTHTLMIAVKLKNTVKNTDMLLRNYHNTDIKPDLKYVELEVTFDVTSNINNAIQSQEYTTKEDASEVTTPMDCLEILARGGQNSSSGCYASNKKNIEKMEALIKKRWPMIKSELRVVMRKLPYYISKTSYVYCSICLFAFKDREQFRHWNHNKFLHDIHKRTVKINPHRLNDELILRVENQLQNRNIMSKARQKRYAEELIWKQNANTTDEQPKNLQDHLKKKINSIKRT